ncbi:hypothetical protein [Streptomyces virginiae]|uniref:hypothetical protein n=1 Tax=Streptomyces virginiae TaxID=1961 RepID=UPI002255CAE9|nr:hypothetical protein [Streptomyces virginiae]MCX4960698.1 hypothetical protein [Streptomyces virginiae]
MLRFSGGSSAVVLVALAVLAVLATGCGGGADTAGEKAPTGDSAKAGGASSSGKPAAAGTVDFDTVFTTEERFKRALPDPASMAGWTPKRAGADIEETPKPAAECGADTHWDCTSVADGDANFEEVGERALFDLVAYADKKAAQDACRKEKDWSAKYSKADVPPVPGVESHAYYRNAGGLDGLDLTMCLGTVIAQVRLEGGGSTLDPATAHSLAQVFVPRIQKAAAS